MSLVADAAACRRRLVAGREAARPEALELVVKLGEAGNEAAECGAHEQACELASEAIALLRVLLVEEPERVGPSLAQALSNLAASHSALGSETAAHEPLGEAIGLYRELGMGLEAAACASELGLSFVALGRADQALAPLSEARAWVAGLDGPEARARAIEILDHLGLCLRALGREAEALACWAEALERAGPPRAARPEDLRRAATIASQLAALSERLEPAAIQAEAWQAAVERWRAMLDTLGAAALGARPKLAEALDSLGLALTELGREADALAATRAAVALRRELARDEPELHRSTLAISLTNLAIDLESNDEAERALELRAEAIEHLRVLAEAEPEDRLGALAEALGDLSLSLLELEPARVSQARAQAEACVEAARALVEFDREYYGPDLARALDLRATVACEAGDHAAAVVDLEQALELLAVDAEADLVGGPRHAELVEECLATFARASAGEVDISPSLRAHVEALREPRAGQTD